MGEWRYKRRANRCIHASPAHGLSAVDIGSTVTTVYISYAADAAMDARGAEVRVARKVSAAILTVFFSQTPKYLYFWSILYDKVLYWMKM